MSAEPIDAVSEQIRQAIRRRFGTGRRFTVRQVRELPELSHVLNIRQRMHYLATSGFLEVVRHGAGNRWSANDELTRFTVSDVSKGGVTVRRRGRGYTVGLDAWWSERMESVTAGLGMSPVLYLRELIESDLARRAVE